MGWAQDEIDLKDRSGNLPWTRLGPVARCELCDSAPTDPLELTDKGLMNKRKVGR